jgi:uncharacterized protein (TIGR03083 family)
VNLSEHLDALEQAGHRFAEVAGGAAPDAPVPTCPGWTMRDLAWHLGEVHRWAGTHVAERRQERVHWPGGVSGPRPDDAALVAWYLDQHGWLLETLRSADPNMDCWSFLPAPSPLAFWARRQAHETSIHRVDAESAVGSVTPFESALAADGVDELLLGFFGSRPRGSSAPDPADMSMLGSIHAHAEDADRDWLLRLSTSGVQTASGGHGADAEDSGHAECGVRATASELYLLFWNRRSADGLDVRGDRALLDHWRTTAQIRWGGA